MAGALDGIRVLEFSEMIAAPLGGMLLADMGAEVIKVEPPGGEAWRLSGQFTPKESRAFISLNRGKRGIVLDLKSPEGRAVVHRIVPSMDVVIVNYRPDTPPKLGLDYETLRALQPSLVYVQNTAFGQRGAAAHRPGYDLVAQAFTGLLAAGGRTTEAGLPSAAPGAPADFATGLAIAWATSAALFARERTGVGQKVDTSLMATALALQTSSFTHFDTAPFRKSDEPTVDERVAEARRAGAPWAEIQKLRREAVSGAVPNAYYRSYETADGLIAVACLTPVLRRKMAAAAGVDDPRFGERAAGDEARAIGAKVVAAFEDRFREQTTGEWLAVFDAAGVPAGPVNLVGELRDHPQVVDNGLVVDLDHPVAGTVRMVGPIVGMSETPGAARSASPALGQHTDEVLAEFGYSPQEIDSLRERGAVA